MGVGTTFGGTITAGDHDFVAVNLAAGQYTFSMVATGASTSHMNDTILSLRNSAGVLIATDDDSGPGYNSTLTVTIATAGTYYLDAQGYSVGNTGAYTLSATAGTRASYDVTQGAGAELVPGIAWNAAMGTATTVTYGFRSTAAGYTVSGSNIGTFTQVTTAEMATMRTLLGAWSEVCGLSFTEVNPNSYTDTATILIGNYTDATDGAGAFAYYPGSTAANSTTQAGDVWLNLSSISTTSHPLGSYARFAMLHELGHAIGLSHPGDYNAAPGVSITYGTNAQFVQDSQQYSVMSYFDEVNTGAQYSGYADTPMMNDIYAAQLLYGVNNTTRSGATTYGFSSNAGSVYDLTINTNGGFCIWDGGGIDTLNASGSSAAQIISLVEGTFSSLNGFASNVSIAYGAVIENAIGGSGADIITGNSANNTLIGNGGNDTLNGGAGTDTADYSGSTGAIVAYAYATGAAVYGGADVGSDSLVSIETIIGTAGVDVFYSNNTGVTINGGGGSNYLIQTSTAANTVHLDTAAVSNINLLYLNSGNDIADVAGSTYAYIFGMAGDDTITLGTAGGWAFGGDGNDTLNGNSGADILVGEIGNDTINGMAGADVVYAGVGDDIVNGGDGNDTIWGEAGNDTLFGGNGNDFILGQDGTDIIVFDQGTDTGYGGTGADTFKWTVANQGADVVADFSHAEGDKISLDHTGFGVAAGLTLVNGTSFFSGAGAHATQATATVYFDTTTNILWFDADGTGAGAAQAITFLSNGGGGITVADILFA
jgi:serralysin